MSTAKRLRATKTQQPPVTPDAEPKVASGKRAVLYLRVSTPSQVKTDYNPEGISLPAQRQACELKRDSLGAETVREFVEAGRTATDIEHRPVFQEMIAWIKSQKNIDYLIVYQFSRIFRNSVDAAITKKELGKHDCRIISTNLDLGEGPESAMVESIMHAVDEFRSKSDGADIAYKMGAKAKSGGTLGRAPMGYVNARDLSEGRNIGIVKFDPERAPLVKVAFELYASGDFSIESLAKELIDRGLRTRPGKHPAGTVSTSKLNAMLRDPYYVGYVSYKGELIVGRHEALISDELFERVQAVLDERSGSGARQRRHTHYLKGVLWCGQCHDEGIESRMIMQWSKGNGGLYLYFFCRRKQQHLCISRYLEGDAVEAAVLDFYGTLDFPSDLAARVRAQLHDVLDDEEKASKLRHEQLTAELLRLDRQEENLIDLAADGNLPTAKVKQRLGIILRQKNKLSQQLAESNERLAVGAALIENALLVLNNPQRLYERMSPEQRQLMNLAIFEKLYIFDDGITDAVFKPPFDELMLVRDAAGLASGQSKESPAADAAGDSSGLHAGPLATAFFGDGSNKRVMVGTEGVEPSLGAV